MGLKIGNLETYGIIYKIENLVNGKIYIGQTTSKDGFKGRYRNSHINNIEKVYYTYLPKTKHEKKSIYNRHLLYAIEKYGFSSFKVTEVLDIAFSKEELDIKEECWINIYDCINNGYNNAHGGSNGKLSEETKKKMKESWKEKIKNGYVAPALGTKHTDEWKREMSIKHSGKNNAMYGVSPKERMDEATFELWRSNISKSVKRGKNPFASKVVCLDTKEVYDCIKDAEEQNNITGISAVCRKIRYSAGGLHWVYYSEYINMTDEDINKIFEIDKQIKEKAKDVNKKKIICLTTNEIFFSVKEAREKYNCDSHISDCLKGRRKYCGKLKDGTKLQWMYYEDYINKESVMND